MPEVGKSWASEEGSPTPLGVTYIREEDTYNFALYSKWATDVSLLLYSAGDAAVPIDRYEFDFPRNKTGRVWHCRLPASRVRPAEYYAYQVGGPGDPAQGHRFDREKILLDPYAKAVHFPPDHSRDAAARPGSNAGRGPLGVLRAAGTAFQWSVDGRPHHGYDAIIYEMHVRGFTAHANSGVAESHRGTFAGVIDKIPYLVELGVTVVELLPVYQFDPLEANYWGYMPLNFFSPHHSYAAGTAPGAQFNEFRAMVKALHEAGIEVVLDVVYNHTTEAGEQGPCYCFRGIDNRSYYLLDNNDLSRYRNDAGCGNVLRASNRAVRKMIMDSMTFWVEEMHVDGFRFDLATIFTRNEDGSVNLHDPPVIAEITSNTAFEKVRLIAEAWDLQSYQLGRNFPGMTWLQWNGRFRDEIRQFVKGDNGMVGWLKARLDGSEDLFPQDLALTYRPYQSINYICSHDGFNLADLVSYNQKTNPEGGTTANYSWNCGHEGDGDVPPSVGALRKRQVKNFCALLMLANGTPMFCMGDEVMRTQRGNNNPYDQDNEITWFDWSLTARNADVFRFFKQMISFRKAHPSISRSTFWNDDVSWYGVNGPPDLGWDSHTLAYCLHGASMGDNDLYVMINAYWEPLTFAIEETPAGGWLRFVDTSLESPADIGEMRRVAGGAYPVGPRSVVVLVGAEAAMNDDGTQSARGSVSG